MILEEESVSRKISRLLKPVVLDVSLRDGGYLNNWEFSFEHIERAVQSAVRMGADIIEVGYLDDNPGLPLAASCPPDFLESVRSMSENSLIAAMIRPSVNTPDQVLLSRKSFVDLVRIPVNLKDIDAANQLSQKCIEYQVPFTFNLTSITCYSLTEIEEAVRFLNKNCESVYIADSRGALLTSKVGEIVAAVKNQWTGPVGYHAHNNLGLAKKNTEEAVQAGCEFIDGSLCGIGLGGRNLDLKDAFEIAKTYRNDLRVSPDDVAISEENLGIDASSNEKYVYQLSGERNIKMEWVQAMIEHLGTDLTSKIIKNIPRSVMFHHCELKPYIEDKYWEQIKW